MKPQFKKLAAQLTSTLLVASGLVLVSTTTSVAALTPSPVTVTFEPNDSSGYRVGSGTYNGYTPDFEGLGGSSLTVSPVAGNTTTVSRIAVAGQPWSGTTLLDLTLPGNSGGTLFSATTFSATIDVYSTMAGTMMLKAEENCTATEMPVEHAGGGWETLAFSSSAVAGCQKVAFFPLFFESGRDNQIVYIDNASFPGALVDDTVATPSTLLTFNDAINYQVDDFGNGAVATARVATPSGGASTYSAKIVRSAGDCWSGATLGMLTTNKSLLSTGNTTISANVWVPTASALVRMALEDSRNGNIKLEADAVATSAGWNRLEWNFSSWTSANTNIYNKISVFPGFSCVNNTDYLGDYYFDDIAFNGATTPALSAQSSTSSSTVSNVVTTWNVRLDSADKPYASTLENRILGWWGGAPAGRDIFVRYMDKGATYTLDYTVTDQNSAPVASQSVVLEISGPTNNVSWTYGGTAYSSSHTVSATTDSNGRVSFTIINTNTLAENNRIDRSAWSAPTTAAEYKWEFKPSIPGQAESDQNVDWIWGHVTDPADPLAAPPSGFTPNTENKGKYPHIRLDKSFLDTNFDASWWDGVWQYRDADTKAYLKYLPVGGTFKLTYNVTDAENKPLAGALVTLIVNANYSCAKTYFVYENSLIGPDDCAGNGQTELPAKRTDSNGQVSFVLTNTNTAGENMPFNLNGLPNGKELGTNIKPNLVGATQQGIDMLFAHFVQPNEAAKVLGPAPVTAKAGVKQVSTFQFLDEAGKPMADQYVDVFINGVESKQTWAKTDASGKVSVETTNMKNAEGTTAVAVSITRVAQLPLTATALINWVPGDVMVSFAGSKNSVAIRVTNANDKTIKFVVDGKTYIRKQTSGSVLYKFPASVGKKKISVTIASKSYVKTVAVTR